MTTLSISRNTAIQVPSAETIQANPKTADMQLEGGSLCGAQSRMDSTCHEKIRTEEMGELVACFMQKGFHNRYRRHNSLLTIYAPTVRSFTTITKEELELDIDNFRRLAFARFTDRYGLQKLHDSVQNDSKLQIFARVQINAFMHNPDDLSARMNLLWALNRLAINIDREDLQDPSLEGVLYCNDEHSDIYAAPAQDFYRTHAKSFTTKAVLTSLGNDPFEAYFEKISKNLDLYDTAEARISYLATCNKLAILTAKNREIIVGYSR